MISRWHPHLLAAWSLTMSFQADPTSGQSVPLSCSFPSQNLHQSVLISLVSLLVYFCLTYYCLFMRNKHASTGTNNFSQVCQVCTKTTCQGRTWQQGEVRGGLWTPSQGHSQEQEPWNSTLQDAAWSGLGEQSWRMRQDQAGVNRNRRIRQEHRAV